GPLPFGRSSSGPSCAPSSALGPASGRSQSSLRRCTPSGSSASTASSWPAWGTAEMCGICAAADVEAVRAMNAAMVHRGPDDEGTWTDPDGRIALGARRLSVIDVGGGHQPLANEDGTVWAVMN